VVDTIDRSLEIVKQQVRVQQWKLRDLADDEDHFRELLREELMKAEAGLDTDGESDVQVDMDLDSDADADNVADKGREADDPGTTSKK